MMHRLLRRGRNRPKPHALHVERLEDRRLLNGASPFPDGPPGHGPDPVVARGFDAAPPGKPVPAAEDKGRGADTPPVNVPDGSDIPLEAESAPGPATDT